MWEKIVLNLLSNAFKFTLEGEIEVVLRESRSHVEFSVRDTGVGIPESELGRVFDRFHQIEATRGRSVEGSGIGLAHVQELVRLHGGNVTVESVYGKGSTFTVSIPLGSSHLAPETTVTTPGERSVTAGAQAFVEEALRWLPDVDSAGPPNEWIAPHQQLGPEALSPGDTVQKVRSRILVADDNADMREYLRKLLNSQYEVATVVDGAAAIEAIESKAPDLLLADVMMPGLDGLELLERIRNNPALGTLPVILLSARAGEEARMEGLNSGADDYVVKPFSARELLVRISSRLEIAKQRKQAAEAQVQNIRQIIEHAPAAVALLSGPDHVFQLVNQQYCAVTGRSETSLIGKPVREALPEIAAQGFLELLDGVFRSGNPYVGREALARLDRRGDGTLEDRYFDFVYQPWRDVNGPNGVFIHAIDITDQVIARRRLEESLAERKRLERAALLLSAIVDSSDDAIVSKDLNGIITSWNKGAERIFGYSAEEVIGQSITIVIPEERQNEEPQILRRLQAGERVDHFETIRRRKDGSLRHISLTISPVKDREGKIIGASKIARDITGRKHAEKALQESEARFRQLADSMPQIVWTARPDGYLDYYNERWYEFSGFERGRFGDESWKPILHPEDVQRCDETYHSAIRSGQPYHDEHRFWDRLERRWRWFMGRALPVRDHTGAIVKWFGTWTDIDNQKRVEDELRRANKDLEQFAYSATHDLKEPLRGVAIYSELLARRSAGKLDGEELEFLGFVREGAFRVERLVSDLLAYMRIGQMEEPIEQSDPNEALREALADLSEAIAESEAQIHYEPLPRVPVHRIHLQQLFQNFVGNAIKYRHPKRRPLVDIRAERQDHMWLFSVRDNGIGIAPEYREQIFGLFKRLHGADYSGTGIGLAICQKIVERYGGRIWVESEQGVGSNFLFTLPVGLEETTSH